jgi:hypothetical protein
VTTSSGISASARSSCSIVRNCRVGVHVALAAALRPCGTDDRVALDPLVRERQGEDRVQEGHHVAHGLRREPAAQHRATETLDVLTRDGLDPALA